MSAVIDNTLLASLDDQQAETFHGISELLKTDRSVVTLHGLAGTGKSYTLAVMARLWGYSVVTPTAKAASVLRGKYGVPATTIHSEFFRLIDERKRQDVLGKQRYRAAVSGERHPIFTQNLADEDKELLFDAADGVGHRTVLLDECSMVGASLAGQMQAIGLRMIAVGDPGQLPPVEDKPFFTQPQFRLQKIHRQALDSPIIRQAWRVRHGQMYQQDGSGFRVNEVPTRADALAADVIICWRRATRDALTDKMRGLHKVQDQCPQPGEPVICLKNNYEFGIFNGQIGRLIEPFEPGDSIIHLEIDGETKIIPDVLFKGMDPPNIRGWQPVTSFDFGYALTAHKAQGSEWDNVMVFDEMSRSSHDWAAWTYTAATRAAKSCLMVPR